MSEIREEQNLSLSGEDRNGETSLKGGEEVIAEAHSEGERVGESLPQAHEEELLQLRAEVERLSAEVEKWRDQALRAAADFENYRRRIQRELSQQIIQAQGDILRALLPVIDSIERGLYSAERAPDLPRLQEGLRLTLSQLHKALEKLGVEAIRPEIGDIPDPERHEVLSTQPAPAPTGVNTILEVVEPGYLYKGTLLRPARIIVSE